MARRSFMVSVCLALLIGMLALSSCGDEAPHHAAVHASHHGYWKYDGDTDPDDHIANRPSDDDIGLLIAAAHGATHADNSAIAALTRRYFADALASDGVAGCKLLQPSLARSLSNQGGGQAGCARALAEVFKREHAHLVVEDPATMTVTGVHVESDAGSITLGFVHAPETGIAVERRHGTGSEIGTWKIAALSDSELP